MNTKINYNNYMYFFEVVNAGGFSNASKTTLVSQPALSYSIKKLEEELGQKLIVKGRKKLELTSYGTALYSKLKSVKAILFDNENSEEKLSIGVIRVIADNFLDKALKMFREKYPKIKLEIIVAESRTLFILFDNFSINLILDKHMFDEGKNNHISSALFETTNCFACSKNFFDNNKELFADTLNFNNWPLVLPNKSKKRRQLEEFLLENNLIPNIVMEIPNSNLLVKLIKNENLVGYFMKEAITDELENNSLVEICVPNLPKNTICATYDLNRVSKPLLDLIQFIKDCHEL